MTLQPGDRIGHYEVVGLLGEGGMGTVYRARDPRLDRVVALKVLRADLAVDPDRQARFVQEAKAVSALNHPNIVTVHDIGTHGEIAYMVMELVDGEPLDQRIPQRGMRLSDVLRISVQIADAFSEAHRAQIVHRDLKPANVMVLPNGRVKVLDFGLAKLLEPATAAAGHSMVTQTTEGTIVGTAAYMSPEQAEGKPLDARSDIFSFGAVLYELCSGRRAFQGDSHASVLAEILREDPPVLTTIRPDVPPELSRLITRCLRKDPARRVQSMADLKVALEELREEIESGKLSAQMPVAAGVGAGAGRRKWPLVAAAGAMAAAIAIAAYLWTQGRAPAATESAIVQPVPLTTYPGREGSANFSPDGNQVTFVWDGEREDNLDVYVKLIGAGPPLRLTTDPLPDLFPKWSPDGRYIAFLRRLERELVAVYVVPALGGPERRLAQFATRLVFNSVIGSLAWTPDAKFLFASGGLEPGDPNHIHRVAVDTGEVRTQVTADPSSDGYTNLALSPDGRTLATVRVRASDVHAIKLFDVSPSWDLQQSRLLTSVTTDVDGLAWTADSRELVFRIAANVLLPLSRVSVSGGEPQMMAWVGSEAAGAAISGASKRLVFSRNFRDTNIWRLPLNGANETAGPTERIASSLFREVFPQYSPDGKRLTFHSNRGGSIQIWTSDADGSRATQLTNMDAYATTGSPRWSPDGQRIVFDSSAGGAYQVYEVNADGGTPRALTSGKSDSFIATWSPDGKWLYFSSDRSGRLEVWRMPASGGEPQQMTRNEAQAPTVSPDNQWLYYTKRDGSEGLWRMPTAGGNETRIIDAIFRYNFALAPGGVYYVPLAPGTPPMSIRYFDFKTGQSRELARLDRILDLGLALSPDGRSLLFTKLDYSGTDLMLVDNFH